VTSQDLSLHLVVLLFRTFLRLFDCEGREEDLTITEEDDGIGGSFGEDNEINRLAASVASMED